MNSPLDRVLPAGWPTRFGGHASVIVAARAEEARRRAVRVMVGSCPCGRAPGEAHCVFCDGGAPRALAPPHPSPEAARRVAADLQATTHLPVEGNRRARRAQTARERRAAPSTRAVHEGAPRMRDIQMLKALRNALPLVLAIQDRALLRLRRASFLPPETS